MSSRIVTAHPRALAALAATALATSGLMAVGTAADAVALPAVFNVGSGAEYAAALDAASSDYTQAHTIRITQSFSLDDDVEALYWGFTDLTIDGGGNTVRGAGDASSPSDYPWDHAFLGAVPVGPIGDLSGEPDTYAPDITVTNVKVTEFTSSGAIFSVSMGLVSLDGVDFSNNASYQGDADADFYTGAAVLSAFGDISVTDSTFNDNDGLIGGVLSNYLLGNDNTSSITVSGSEFTGNAAGVGGAILAAGDLTVSDSEFTSNEAMIGGAIYSERAATVAGSTFTDNNAHQLELPMISIDEYLGGAILAGGTLDVADSSFSNNSADSGGAISLDTGVTASGTSSEPVLVLDVDQSTFDGNSAQYGAGAIEVGSPSANQQSTTASVDITNSTFVDNAVAAQEGTDSAGALVLTKLDGYDVALASNTFADNSGADAAHVWASLLPGDSVAVISNAFSGTDLGCELPAPTVTAMNFDADGSCTDDWSGDGDIGDGLDAMLGALADNGGATKTMLPAAESPLIDGAALIDDECALDSDQRDVGRPQGDACDIGSVEVEAAPEPAAPVGGDVAFQIKTDKGMINAVAHGAIAVDNITWTAAADVTSTAPAGLVLPLGIASFDVAVANAGDSVTIDLTLPLAVTQFWKIQNGDWAQVDGAIIDSAGTGITYTLTDGGTGDEDGSANAVIVDPIAPAVGAAFTG